MGTRTYSRRRANGTIYITPAGRARMSDDEQQQIKAGNLYQRFLNANREITAERSGWDVDSYQQIVRSVAASQENTMVLGLSEDVATNGSVYEKSPGGQQEEVINVRRLINPKETRYSNKMLNESQRLVSANDQVAAIGFLRSVGLNIAALGGNTTSIQRSLATQGVSRSNAERLLKARKEAMQIIEQQPEWANLGETQRNAVRMLVEWIVGASAVRSKLYDADQINPVNGRESKFDGPIGARLKRSSNVVTNQARIMANAITAIMSGATEVTPNAKLPSGNSIGRQVYTKTVAEPGSLATVLVQLSLVKNTDVAFKRYPMQLWGNSEQREFQLESNSH